ncbi:MAG: hypothetical protein NDI61_05290 [Bdellovibrionaceae bacterium]|nr:hypothetical protein [Pseudobdellovibrionaceae bacterium]
MKFNQEGSVLVNVIVMIAALLILSGTFLTTITDLQKQIALVKGSSSRQFDVNQMIKQIKLPSGLVESAGLASNGTLATCLLGGAAGACTENCCQAGVEGGFHYLDPADTETDPNKKKKLIGTEAAPVFYRRDGSVCGGGATLCHYGLWATFVASCPGGSATCDHAEHLRVHLRLRGNPKPPDDLVAIRDRDYNFIYIVGTNYKPSIVSISDITLTVGEEREVVVTGDSGHPSEIQNFLFTKCLSTAPAIVQMVTPANQPFASGVSRIRIKGVAAGSSDIVLQISDGATENNISDELRFRVTVN